jgi:hypothetical protein
MLTNLPSPTSTTKLAFGTEFLNTKELAMPMMPGSLISNNYVYAYAIPARPV